MTSLNSRPNPYVGPRAFTIGETLYGREHELRDLLNLLIAERIVLLYSPSGAGKTSLISAGLIPRLSEAGFHVLPLIRVNQELPARRSKQRAFAPSFNRYVFSTLLSLEEEFSSASQIDPGQLSSMNLPDYLEKRPKPTSESSGSASEPLSEALIFDQFEEVLTIEPNDPRGKAAFFVQIGAALRQRNRWALFSIREDYVGALDPYLRPIPTRLSNRFRLGLLEEEAARQAIQLPAKAAQVNFTDEAAHKLVDDLRKVQVQRADATMEEQLGPYVEPVQLQVVCYRLWQKLPADKSVVSAVDVVEAGDVSRSLSEFYAERISSIANHSGVKERLIRAWIQRALITDQGIRSQVMMGLEQSQGMDNRVIRLLEDAHLVRAEKRRGVTWFELAHDRLIHPVRSNNEAWFQAHLTLLQRQAELWQKENRPDDLLLHDQTLLEAEKWSENHPDELTNNEQEFLYASRKAQIEAEAARHEQEQKLELAQKLAETERSRAEEQARSTRRLRQRLIATLVVASVAILLFAFALYAMNLANRASAENARLADSNAKMARQNATSAALAQAASTLAVANAATAQVNAEAAHAAGLAAMQAQSTAEYNATQAKISQLEAQRQAAFALSRQLASQAETYRQALPDLAALLAVESYHMADTWDARNALLTSLQRNMRSAIQEYGRPIPPQQNDIEIVAFSSDGERLAWGSSDGSLTIWNYQLQEAERRLSIQSGPALSAAFSPDGKLLASGSSDGIIAFWDVASGDLLWQTTAPSQVKSLSFNPDGSLLASTVGNRVLIWDIRSRQVRREFPSTQGYVYTVDWSPDGKWLASGNADGSIWIWNSTNGEALLRLAGHKERVWCVEWSPDGKLLASGGADRKIIIWDPESGKPVGKPINAPAIVYTLAFSPDGQNLASGGEDMNINLWDVSSGSLIAQVPYHTRMIVGVDFGPGNLLASASFDNRVGLLKLVNQQPLNSEIVKIDGQIIAITQLFDDSLLLAERKPGQLDLWKARGETMSLLRTLDAEVVSAAFSVDGTRIALGKGDGTILIESLNNGNTRLQIQASLNPVLSLAFTPDSKRLASSYCAALAQEWTRRDVCELNQIQLWDASSGKALGQSVQGHSDFIRALAFSPQGDYLASGSDDKRILLWNLQNLQADLIPLDGHASAISALAFSPDGRTLASSSADHALILWDLPTHQALGEPLVGTWGELLSLVFSVDSRKLYTGSRDGSLLGWDTDPAGWIARNCKMAGRNMSLTEWQQLIPALEYHPTTCPDYPPGGKP